MDSLNNLIEHNIRVKLGELQLQLLISDAEKTELFNENLRLKAKLDGLQESSDER